MSYRLQLDEPITVGIRKIAAHQLARLERLLTDSREAGTGHHTTRRCVKKLRSLLLLLAPALGKKRWRRVDRRLSGIGRALSGKRDQAVVLDVLAGISMKHSDKPSRAAAKSLASHVLREMDAAFVPKPDHGELLRAALEIGDRLAKLPLEDLDAEAITEGLVAEYRAGRKAAEAAYLIGTGDAFHDLRKHVQRHLRHLKLLRDLWSEDTQANLASAQQIAQSLGRDHDLDLLQAAIARAPKHGPINAFIGLEALCRDEQRGLRASLEPLVRSLYAERPKELRRRVASYWAAAPSRQPNDL